MPAYGPTHSDEDLWAIVAFLNRLPVMTEKEYKEMGEENKNIKDGYHRGDVNQENVHIHKDGKKHVH